MSHELWVVEYNGTAQLGCVERYEAIKRAESNFGDQPDQAGLTYRLKRYVPSEDKAWSRELCLEELDT